MRPFSSSTRASIFLISCLSILVVCPVTAAMTTPAWAGHTPQINTLNSYEVLLFGKSRPHLQLETRLRAVETNIFGKHDTGSTSQRLSRIASELETRKAIKLMPPIAPALDTGYVPPRSANSFTSNHKNHENPRQPDETIGILREALSLHAAGKITEAEITFQKVLSIDPYNTDALFSLGAIEEARGDFENAGKHYRDALSASPGDPEISQALSSVERKLREKPPVMADTSRRSSRNGMQELKMVAAGAADDYRKQDYDSALSKLQYLASNAPADASVQYGLAQAWRGKGDPNRAHYHMQHAQSLSPQNANYASGLSELNKQLWQDNSLLARSPEETKPTGDIVPFTPDVLPATGSRSGSGFRLSGSGLGSIASLISSMRSAGFSSAPGYGVPVSFEAGSSSLKTRLKRAAGGSIAGAAVGGLAGRGTEVGVKRGAITGALTGGLAGLMFGGL